MDPQLIPFVPGDILPTVSRRDVLRKAADVWTTGNRIYRCNGPNVLLMALKAMEEGEYSSEAVQRSLRCSLNSRESELLATAVAQVEQIVETECQEMWSISNGRV